ncbi:hypothetical protein KXX40_008379, partial [Aspergillus fumigatus]
DSAPSSPWPRVFITLTTAIFVRALIVNPSGAKIHPSSSSEPRGLSLASCGGQRPAR